MEEKDLPTSGPITPINEQDTAESIVQPEEFVADEPVPVFQISEPVAPADENPWTQPSARERLRGAVQEQNPKVSDFMRRGGLFEGYEVSSAKEMPIFMRVFAASALFHLVVFAVGLQLPAVVETTCESTEFTQQLCDTIYVASLIGGSNHGFVDEDYTPSEIPSAEDVTFITTDSFQYPDGYWTLQDEINGIPQGDELGMINPTLSDVNGINNTGSPTTLDLTAPPNLPKNNPGALSGNPADLNSLFPSSGGGTGKTVRVPKNGKRTVVPAEKTQEQGEQAETPDPKKGNDTAAVKPTPKPADPDIETNADGIEINKKPLKTLAGSISKKVKNNEVDIAAPFTVVAEGVLGKDGKFDLTKTVFTKNEGDEKMVGVAKEAMQAVNDSGWLSYLKALGNKKVVFSIQQDQDKISVLIQSEVDTEQKAASVASGLNTIISIGKLANKETDEGILLSGAIVTNQGKTFVLNFSLPQDIAQPMIKRKLAEVEKKTSENGLSTAVNKAAK